MSDCLGTSFAAIQDPSRFFSQVHAAHLSFLYPEKIREPYLIRKYEGRVLRILHVCEDQVQLSMPVQHSTCLSKLGAYFLSPYE